MNEKIKFTDNRIKRIIKQEKPEKGRIFFIDKDQPSLRMHLSSSGRVSFQFYKWDPIRKRPAAVGLGSYPALSIEKARKLCDDYAADVAAGVDVAKRKADAKAESTLNDAFTRYLDDYAKTHKRDWINDERRYNKYIRSEIGKKRVSDITVSTVQKLQNKLLKREKERGEGTLSPATVNRVLALVSSIYGVTQKNLPNPVSSISKSDENGRDRKLEVIEFPKFWSALEAETERRDVVDAIKILLLTGQRRSNVFGMKWTDIDLAKQEPRLGKDDDGNDVVVYVERPVWKIPAAEYKGKRNIEVELTESVVEILRRIKAQKQKSIFVFPAPGNLSKPLNDIRRPWSRIKKRAEIENLRLHDLRHTFGSWLANTGANAPIIQSALGHQNLATSEKYIHTQSDAIRKALELTQAAMLDLSKGNQKIVSINGDKK